MRTVVIVLLVLAIAGFAIAGCGKTVVVTTDGKVVTKGDAQRASCRSNQRQVDGAIQSYEAVMNGLFPTGFDNLINSDTPVLKKEPRCPSGTKPYIWVDGKPPEISCPNLASHTQ